MSVRILVGDVRDRLRDLPDESVHCVVTSPPFWGLRDYGVAGQLGLERTLGEHIAVMVDVFREVRRVLRSDGTLWLNYGDSYATSVNGRSAADTKAIGNDDRTFRDKPFSTIGPIYEVQPESRLRRGRSGNLGNGGVNGKSLPEGRIVVGGFLKPKDICGVPWRVAFALQEDGWWLRQDIIWSKLNPMPESVTDRCTKAHEYVFLLTKSQRYFYDAFACREAAVSDHGAGNDFSSYHNRIIANSPLTGRVKPKPPWNDVGGSRNRRTVWTITTDPFPEAHFATFPPALVEPCILAGTSAKGVCASCGAPYSRSTEDSPDYAAFKVAERTRKGTGMRGAVPAAPGLTRGTSNASVSAVRVTTGWESSCRCAPSCVVPAVVMDPFGGSGTTGLVADRLGRNAVLIELNPEYVEMARSRINKDHGALFGEIVSTDHRVSCGETSNTESSPCPAEPAA